MTGSCSLPCDVVARRTPSSGRTVALFFAASMLLQASSLPARADDPHLGVIEYEIACMPCHGVDGHGDGPRAKFLKTAPADLTKIAKANNGKFPFKKIADIVDGRAATAAHGRREMPVWGNRYRVRADANESPAQIEKRARAQIAALVQYLRAIQER